jgi:hypothetical protein
MKAARKSSRKSTIEVFEPPQGMAVDAIVDALEQGKLEVQGLMPWSSNYTFLGAVICGDLKFSVVYKPGRGERPLWDFDHGSLCNREVAAFLVSRALGNWPAIPPTVLRDGPHGPGSVQQFVLTDYNVHYFTIQDDPKYHDQFQRLAIFDYLVNNADRKGGHCLLGEDDVIWAIDHGLTFHTDHKLRTVIWEYADERIPRDIYADLKAFKQEFQADTPWYKSLQCLLSAYELERLLHRLNKLLKSGRFPTPLGMRDYPYPPV